MDADILKAGEEFMASKEDWRGEYANEKPIGWGYGGYKWDLYMKDREEQIRQDKEKKKQQEEDEKNGKSQKITEQVRPYRPKSFEEIKEVHIDDEGVFKYMLIKIEIPKTNQTKILVRGGKHISFHEEVMMHFKKEELKNIDYSEWKVNI